MLHDLIPMLRRDSTSQVRQGIALNLDHLAGVDVHKVIVLNTRRHFEPRRLAPKGQPMHQPRRLQRGERAIYRGGRYRLIRTSDTGQQFFRDGVILGLSQHRQNCQPLLRHAQSGFA